MSLADVTPPERAESRVLLVEDQPVLARTGDTTEEMLAGENYLVERSENGNAANDRIAKERFDLIIMDFMLPGMPGFEVCSRVRKQGISTPILILTARGRTLDTVHGLRLGADDCLSKPFDPIEFIARVQALLRRATRENMRDPAWYRFGNITVDFARKRVYRAGARIDLSGREFTVLKYLIDHQGEVVTRDQLLTDVWGHSVSPLTRTVDVHILRLRQKLERDPKYPDFILTAHMEGYRFMA